jgi:hypothetical protein
MNRLKFMGAPLDETVHLEAHTAVGAERMVAEAGSNWIDLTYDRGFPPEVEEEDWRLSVRGPALADALETQPALWGLRRDIHAGFRAPDVLSAMPAKLVRPPFLWYSLGHQAGQ